MERSPTPRLLAGLLITLLAVALYSAYTVRQVHMVREIQQQIVDRNRRDSLQLLRIQDNLNSLGLAMRDMLDQTEPYPLTAWSAQFQRIRHDLDDAIRLEAQLASGRAPAQTEYLSSSVKQFWEAVDRMFGEASNAREAEARNLVRDSLQARQAALATTIARLLVQNNESEQRAAAQIGEIYSGVERNVYLFLIAMAAFIAATGIFVIASNRRLFHSISELSIQRGELAQRLISTQEETLRSISRELHDEFGQILTAIGAMLSRAQRQGLDADSPLAVQLTEVREIVQETLEKVRSLSQALQPVILQEEGLFTAIEWFLPAFERQTGIAVKYEKPASTVDIRGDVAIHIFRALQEALNNVVKHSGATEARVRLETSDSALTLEVEDRGRGMTQKRGRGVGLIAMSERAALIHGQFATQSGPQGGTIVRLTAPLAPSGAP